MIKENIKDFIIIYNEGNPEIEEFKTIFMNNYELFKVKLKDNKIISLIELENEDILYLDKPLEYLNQHIKNIMLNDEIIASFKQASLEEMYVDFIIRKLNIKGNNSFVLINPNITNESFFMIFYYFLAYYYCQEKNITDYLEYIKYSKNNHELLRWLIDKVRFSTCNLLLKNLLIYFDEDFLNNIDIFVEMINNESNKQNVECALASQIPLMEVDRREIDFLFIKFLEYIHAPSSWFKLYHVLKSQKKIIYKNLGSTINKSVCFKDNNELKILIDSDGSLNDFLNLVHEFMHYVSWNDKSNVDNFSVIELGSIFFQNLAAHFLVENGYDEKIIQSIEQERKSNNWLITTEIAPIFNVINDYLKKGEIKEDEAIKEQQKILDLIYQNENTKEAVMKMYQKLNIPFDAKEIVYRKYDNMIRSILEKGETIILSYQYIVGTYIANMLLNNVDNNTIQKMVMIVDQFKKMTISDIEKILNIDIFNKKKGRNCS